MCGGGGGGSNIIVYDIDHLSPRIFKSDILLMESSDNLASSHKIFTYHRQYYSVDDISFYWGGSLNYGKIFWHPNTYSRRVF